jgi:hypothetical protein
MVILGFYAVVARAAVVRARRPPDVAGLAELGGDFHGS